LGWLSGRTPLASMLGAIEDLLIQDNA